MASYGGSAGGGPGHWGHGAGGGDGNAPHPHPREADSPSHHKREREDPKSNHETVVSMLSMLTLGVESASSSYGHEQDSPMSSSSTSRSDYGLISSSTNADNQRMLLISMANTPESCLTLRRAGCIPLLVELIHPPRGTEGIQEIIQVRAARALKNIVQFNPDEKEKKKELRVLRLLEGIRLFTEAVKGLLKKQVSDAQDGDRNPEQVRATTASSENIQHPTTSLGAIMKLSYDQQHRCTMCLLGAIHCLSDLLVSDHLIHGNHPSGIKEHDCFNLRRLTGMALTNLTVYDKTNKALLCGMKDFLRCLVSQLECDNEELCKISASVLRNLSCRVDSVSMAALSEVSPCSKLMIAAMKADIKEATLKANLGAVWNLSAQSPQNMADISLASNDALPFLISLMKLNNPIMKEMKNPMTIVEHASGILRNISQHIRVVPELKKVLRENHCYEILLQHLTSSSMLVVGNACGAICSFSGGPECEEDQRKLLDLGAIPMLKSLVYSKDQRISQGSSTALRNLLSSKFAKEYTPNLDSRVGSQIYTSHGGRQSSDRFLSSPQQQHHKPVNSEPDIEIENLVGRSPLSSSASPGTNQTIFNQHRMVQPVPPVAHQQSTSSAASLFQQQRSSSAGKNQFPLSLPLNQSSGGSGGHRNRPSTINYYPSETEPLDLTITSAKSSPSHVISARAAEFAGMSSHLLPRHSHKGQDSKHFHHTRSHSSQSQLLDSRHQSYSRVNANPDLNQDAQHQNSWQMDHPGANFNRSCPEMLSRFQNSNQMQTTRSHDSKPLDYSASGSASSSCRGGGGEGSASEDVLNDSNGVGGGGGDTTFNYSLRFAEDDGDEHEDANHHHDVHTGRHNNAKSEDTVKTYCYEGTPQFSKSNSCQDLVQELEFERDETANCNNNVANTHTADSTSSLFTKSLSAAGNHKLEPIDEVKPYYVENTPAAFSRASSLSSIHSSDEATQEEINADFAESSELQQQQSSVSMDKLQHDHVELDQISAIKTPPHPVPRKRRSLPATPCRVTFSAEETPLMFSRCSSVASLESDVDGMGPGEGGMGNNNRNDDDFSDYSRRASEVVSPSELPDSPRGLAAPVRFSDNNTQPPLAATRRQHPQPNADEDVVKVYSVSMAEKSGFNSCRSLSPLTVDGEELPVIGKDKLDLMRQPAVNNATRPNNDNNDEILTTLPAADIQSSDDRATSAEKNKGRVFHNDEMKVFAMEGTPFYGVSNATSLSDLMADMDDVVVGDIEGGVGSKPNNISNQQMDDSAAQAEEQVRSTNVQNAALAVVNGEDAAQRNLPKKNGENGNKEHGTDAEPIYSDAQLLEKCIRVGKAMGIPKSQSEFRIGVTDHPRNLATTTTVDGNINSAAKMSSNLHRDNTGKQKLTSKSQDFEFDDPDLAALIQIGRNRTTDKDKTPKSKNSKRSEKSKSQINSSAAATAKSKDVVPDPTPQNSHSQQIIKEDEQENTVQSVPKRDSSVVVAREGVHPILNKCQSDERKSSTEECISEDSPSTNNNDTSNSTSEPCVAGSGTGLPIVLDPNQISTMSLGSEWNDDTPTFSSPIPSMSISTAFKLAESLSMDNSKPPLPPKASHRAAQNMNESINNVSCLSVSVLLDNVEPPSTFSNLISSTDCFPSGGGNPQIQPRSQASTLSDKLNKKWKALTDAANNSSHSNLTGQKLPLDYDMENSMISVASIKSEIASESCPNDVFESAVEDFEENGLNTYTIFPPENANRLSGVKSTDLSDGRNTVISEDFTDAEDIEEYETAPIDDQSLSNKSEDPVVAKPEKADDEKAIPSSQTTNKASISTVSSNSRSITSTTKPLMEVHPLIGSTNESNKYNTFVVKKSSMSPRSSPRQKRREDPDRYKTHTINPINMGGKAFVNDANGNPSLKFATFRVGGPKVIKPLPESHNMNMDSDSTNSPASTPGHSPKGIRGRRRPLYSSLPPSAIVRKERQKSVPPPVPPKPARTSSSPARSTTSSAAGGVYVRPTRTTELRNAANNSRDCSPPTRRIEATTNSSRNSSNSSLNLIHSSSRMSDYGGASSVCSSSHGRPKVAPKPPLRTTPSMTPGNRDFSSGGGNGGSSSNVPIHIKASNSSFGLGQHTKMGDFNDCSSANMKGYSTLPKSSKFLSPTPFSADRYSVGGSDSKESIPGSEKSSRSGMGKITNLWKKMDFRSHKEVQIPGINTAVSDCGNGKQTKLPLPEKDKKSSTTSKSKLQNFFGRGKKEKPLPTGHQLPSTGQGISKKGNNQPFRDPLSVHPDPACNIISADNAPASTGGNRVRSREGANNKVIVPPFNYTPPDRSNNSQTNASSTNNGNSTGGIAEKTENIVRNPTPALRISSKITTV